MELSRLNYECMYIPNYSDVEIWSIIITIMKQGKFYRADIKKEVNITRAKCSGSTG